ncbi:hypothetical protein [Algibacter sp. L1A34]|uniref:hypothetical protein n=1 Tax=Algibacter sp. L1A34 TaxID=2686365 RepID=UPI00131B7E0A|nr:hypothetical protein [Algibacter sp. L1A34]
MKLTKMAVFFFLIFQHVSYSQGKINKAEEELNKEKITTNTNHSISKSSKTYNDYDSRGNFSSDVIGGLFIQLFAYTAYGVAIESPFEMEHKASDAYLTKHPYAKTNTGHYSYEWNDNTEIFTTTISNRLIYESNSIYGNHLNLDLRFLKRLELELDFLQLWEHKTNVPKNSLGIYTALAKYNRVRTERFNASWGLGVAYVAGNVNKLGFTYGLSAELFFKKPFSLESNFNQTLVNSETINKFNGLLNYHKKQYKYILGYEHLKIASVPFSNVTAGFGISF